MLAQRQDRVEEIARLNEQANEVLVSRLGQEMDFGQWVDKEIESKLKVFDDPLFSQEHRVVQKKTELQAGWVAMQAHMADCNAHMEFLQKFAAEARGKDVLAAKKKADDEAKEAAEAAETTEDDRKAAAKKTEGGKKRSKGSEEGRGREK